MEELIEVLLANPFLILVILGGLISFFRGNKERAKQEEENQPPSRPTQTQTTRQPSQQQPTQQRTTVQRKERVEIDNRSIDEHRIEQMDQLRKQLSVDSHHMPKEASESHFENLERLPLNHTPYRKQKFKKKMKKNVTKQGLINGIIMAEVLGPPRSKKPYRNIVLDRNKH